MNHGQFYPGWHRTDFNTGRATNTGQRPKFYLTNADYCAGILQVGHS